jgi:hypothetical protein
MGGLISDRHIVLEWGSREDGESLEGISKLCGIAVDLLVEALASAAELTVQDVKALVSMKAQGKSLLQISKDLHADVTVLRRVFPELHPDTKAQISSLKATGLSNSYISRTLLVKEELVESYLQDTAEEHQHIYSYRRSSGHLYRTDLATGYELSLRLPCYSFGTHSCISEVPGQLLLITCAQRSVVSMDILREYAVLHRTPMLSLRFSHVSLYYSLHLYVLGGELGECERYVVNEDRWESLKPLPVPCIGVNAIEMKGSIYIIGGTDSFQRLNVEQLTWEVLKVTLPSIGVNVPCFKLSATACQCYLLVGGCVHCFDAASGTIKAVKPLYNVHSEGLALYRGGSLFCSSREGAASRLRVF